MSPRIEYFKFYEAMSLTGQFNGMSEHSRNEKLTLLVGAVADHKLLGISSSIPHRIFEQLFSKHPDPKVSNPYILSFYNVVARLAAHYAEAKVVEKIEFVFDVQPGGKSMALVEQGWQAFLETAPPEFLPLLTTHPPTFQNDKDIIPLQAADLLAGWVRAMNEAQILGREQPLPIWGERGASIPRLYRYLTDEIALSIYEQLFGAKPIRAQWLNVWRASIGRTMPN